MTQKPASTVVPMPPKTRDIFGMVYRFRQKFLHPQNTTEWWDRCVAEGEALCRHFGNDALCVDLVSVCISDIEREMKGERSL